MNAANINTEELVAFYKKLCRDEKEKKREVAKIQKQRRDYETTLRTLGVQLDGANFEQGSYEKKTKIADEIINILRSGALKKSAIAEKLRENGRKITDQTVSSTLTRMKGEGTILQRGDHWMLASDRERGEPAPEPDPVSRRPGVYRGVTY